MAISHDASADASVFTNGSTVTWTHTPVGNPRGVVVAITQDGTTTTDISSVSYGSLALSLVTVAYDTAGEVGGAYLYFLGSSVPAGAQTVTIQHTGSAATKQATSATVLAGTSATAVVASAVTYADQANPKVWINSGSTSALAYFAAHSGRDSVSQVTIDTASFTTLNTNSPDLTVSRIDRELTPTTSGRSVGYGQVSDDIALVALAVGEVPDPPAGGLLGRRYRIPQPPSSITGPLAAYLALVAKQLNSEGFISIFSGTNPNTSGVTGIPGNLLINIGSASTWTRLWVMGGSVASIATNGWQMFRTA